MNRALAAVFLLLCSRSAGATVTWPLDLTVDLSVIRDLSAETALEVRVFGVEMVEIPEGAFTLGDPDPAALKFAAFYRSNAAGSPDGLIEIRSEAAIEVGAAMGALNYQVEQPEYQGNRQGRSSTSREACESARFRWVTLLDAALKDPTVTGG